MPLTTQCTEHAQQGIKHLQDPGPSSRRWYVVWTRSHCETLVHDQLVARGFSLFLPMIHTWFRRNGTRHVAHVPMFPGYLFLQHCMDKVSYLEVTRAKGIVRLLGEGWDRLAEIPEAQIEVIRKVYHADLPTLPYPYLQEGKRVRITAGVLAGVEGILVKTKANKGKVVLSIDLLRQSVAVEVDCSLVCPA
jgi:transcription termination/antitermination protein NusG